MLIVVSGEGITCLLLRAHLTRADVPIQDAPAQDETS
jgi:hypothetical protein